MYTSRAERVHETAIETVNENTIETAIETISENTEVIEANPPEVSKGMSQGKIRTTTENGIIKPSAKSTRAQYFTLDELMSVKINPIEFVIDGLVPSVGLSAIVGKPKTGKSFMVVDMAYQIVTGGTFLGRSCKRTEVLYYALEDNKPRLQERFGKILTTKERSPFHMCIKVQDLDHGFINELTEFLKDHPHVKVVFIDTFKKIRGRALGRENQYDWDYRECGLLQQFAIEHGISIILLHHLKKGQTVNDPTEDISGSNGIFGALDTALIIVKQNRSDKEAKMFTIGRDIEEETYQIEFQECRWKMMGIAEDVEKEKAELEFRRSLIARTIISLVDANNGSWSGTATELLSQGAGVVGRQIANNATSLGKKLSSLSEQLYKYECISYFTVSGKNGNNKHCFRRDIPFNA